MGIRRNKKKHKKAAPKRKSKKKIIKKKRDLTPTPGLQKNLFSRVKQEYHDIDYADQLSAKDKKWLSQFMEEYLGANLDDERMKNKYNRKTMHKTKKDRKKVFDMNNARNRDIYSLNKAVGKIHDIDDEAVVTQLDTEYIDDGIEDSIIKKIDEA